MLKTINDIVFKCFILLLLLTGLLFSADYYIDDSSNTGDIWTPVAIGNDSNDGQTIITPKVTVSNLLSTYSLQPGDTVYIDTGIYTQFFKVISDDSGDSSGYLTFIGAGTNKTIFNSTNVNVGIKLTNVGYIKLFSFTIKNANNQNLYLDYATNTIVSNLKLEKSKGDGLFLYYSDYNKIKDLKIENCINKGLYLFYGNNNNLIYNSDISFNTRGIYVRYSSHNSIVNNMVYSNSNDGIYIDIANHTFLTDNNVFNNFGNGISLPRGDDDILFNNKCYNNKKDGITLYFVSGNWCDRNLFYKNVCVHNYSNGIHINGSFNIFISNIIATNGKDGLNHWGANNTLSGNEIYSNHLSGVWLAGASGIVISNNNIHHNGINGIATAGLDGASVLFNRIHHNGDAGLSFYWSGAPNWGCENHFIKGNRFYNNQADGFYIDGKFNDIISNTAYSNGRHGIYMKGDNNFTNMFNVAYHNQNDGIFAENIQQSLIRNCTLFKNNGNGLRVINPTDVTVRNCISVSNNIGYSNFDVLTYSLAFGNSTADYSFTPGTGCITNDPYFQSINPIDTSFLYLSGLKPSPAIDTGDPNDPVPSNGGAQIDMGRYEYIFTNTLFSVKKVNSVSLAGNSELPIPGATLKYTISYSNHGDSAGCRLIIYDRIPDRTHTDYITNSHTNSRPGWITEWSTNKLPDQLWTSGDYTNVHPGLQSIKWIRWKKNVAGETETGFFRYSLIIK